MGQLSLDFQSHKFPHKEPYSLPRSGPPASSNSFQKQMDAKPSELT